MAVDEVEQHLDASMPVNEAGSSDILAQLEAEWQLQMNAPLDAIVALEERLGRVIDRAHTSLGAPLYW